MAGCEEGPKVPPTDARKAFLKRRVREREFVESWFGEQALGKDEQETWSDFEKRICSEFMVPLKKKVDKAKLVAVEEVDGERKLFSGTAAVETAIDKIQAEKMDKTVVEVLDGETGKATFHSMHTEKMDKCAESDPTADDDLSIYKDWFEEREKRFLEREALSKRIGEEIEQIHESLLTEGYPDFDDDERAASVEKFLWELWNNPDEPEVIAV